MHRIGKKYILQAIPDSAIARTFLYLLRHLRFTLPSTNLLIQTKFFYFIFLICCYNIPFKSRKRTGICVSIPAGGILKQKLLSVQKANTNLS